MTGPTPKNPRTRQRRNRVTTAAQLIDSSPLANGEVPSLPDRRGENWSAEVVAWWRDVWSSPAASEYIQSDVHGLVMLAELVELYWQKPTTALAAEIRLQRQCFGLSPIDRRRLQWEIKRVEKPKPDAPKKPERLDDPRSALKLV